MRPHDANANRNTRAMTAAMPRPFASPVPAIWPNSA
jgi:hypothetical protein